MRLRLLAAFATVCIASTCSAQLKLENDAPLTTQPRSWDDEKALCADALLAALGRANCPESTAPLLLPALLLLREGLAEGLDQSLGGRVAAETNLSPRGLPSIRMGDEARISLAQAAFLCGQTGGALLLLREDAFRHLDVDAQQGDSQALLNARFVVRAARLTGHLGLRQRAIEALRQTGPLLEDLEERKKQVGFVTEAKGKASAAILACCDAYQLTSDRWFIELAVRWANLAKLTEAPYPGLPGQSCARDEDLIAAYAMQDLCEYDSSQPWRALAQGATNSAMYAQVRDGDARGYLPTETTAMDCVGCEYDVPPTWIVLNECRLRGNSGEVRTRRVPGRVGEALINSAFDVPAVLGGVGEGTLAFSLIGTPGTSGFTAVVPAQEPKSVDGAGERAKDSAALDKAASGWLYHREAQALIIKSTMEATELRLRIDW